MPDDRNIELSRYRLSMAKETCIVAEECLNSSHYKDSINRSYYAAFYAVRAVLAIEGIDFKRHKDVIAYFNKTYIAPGIFPKELGRKLSRLQQKREQSDYDDFYIASIDEAKKQLNTAKALISAIENYLKPE